mmetsp:Transcript_11432/g.21605  ORF Transcript_11432/g.21605 Transcript_11432/m.21605 type:complete len:104 (-) Transcript_11432:448-759(-)
MRHPQILQIGSHLHKCTAVTMVSPVVYFEELREGVKLSVPALVPAMQEMLVDEVTLRYNGRHNIIHVCVHHDQNQHIFDGQGHSALVSFRSHPVTISKTVKLC